MDEGRARAAARTQRFDRPDVDDSTDASPTLARRAEPTGRIGTFAATLPESPGPALEDAPPPPSASLHLAVHAPPSEPRPAGPGRARRVHRAIELASSEVKTDVDLEAVPARVAARTERLARPRPRSHHGALWILCGAIALSILVLAAAFAVRDATHVSAEP